MRTIEPRAFAAVAAAVIAFGIAFGYVEAAVVVYLRSAIEAGAVAPAQDPETLGTYEVVEVAREAATLVMIGTIGWLVGRSRLERLAWAAVVFGTWDIVYYLGLRLTIGWPASLDTWDVLFLIPSTWVGPVWAPIAVSVALVGVGLVAARRLRAGGVLVVRRPQVAAGLLGGLLVIASFLVDAARVIADGGGPWSGWPVFWAGMALASVAALRAFRGDREKTGGVETFGAVG